MAEVEGRRAGVEGGHRALAHAGLAVLVAEGHVVPPGGADLAGKDRRGALGAFAVLHVLSQNGKEVENEDDLVGLGKTHPGMALVMVLFLFSLIGMPLTAGFVGKFLLFFDAPPVAFTLVYSAFGLLVLASLVWVRPRWRRGT